MTIILNKKLKIINIPLKKIILNKNYSNNNSLKNNKLNKNYPNNNNCNNKYKN